MSIPAHAKPVAFVLTRDRAISLPFYRDVLGLRLLFEDPFSAVFDIGHGAIMRLTTVQDHTPNPHTVLGWEVDDLDATMAGLRASGVEFKVYEFLGMGNDGIWTSPDGAARIAWF
ncbi:MAG: VOC family protein, partial [Hyphomonadaceae bacterium]|nr:VOC family protein [Hyphomonadaceae bacterium]